MLPAKHEAQQTAPPPPPPPPVAPTVSGSGPPPPPPPISEALIESLNRTDPLANLKASKGTESGKKNVSGFNEDVVESLKKLLAPSSTGDNLRPSDLGLSHVSSRSRSDLSAADDDSSTKPKPLASSRDWIYEPQRRPTDQTSPPPIKNIVKPRRETKVLG